MNRSEMETTLCKIADSAQLVYSKETHWGVSAMQLFPPATEKQILSLSKSFRHPLPASYRQFLSLHNGCLNFWPRFTILGSEGEPLEFIKEKIEEAREFQTEYAADETKRITADSIAKFETASDMGQEYFLPNHIVFGANGGGEFLMFNEMQVTPEGESEVIHYTYDGGAYYRYPGFASFLAATREQLEKRIKSKKYAPK